ncbi:MAG: hypothetical protein Q7K39_01880 [Candidatus Magasanikbacteria bacterium]|nr:hypothetical protein [Candidatus Magasanikbacteria bacterium]
MGFLSKLFRREGGARPEQSPAAPTTREKTREQPPRAMIDWALFSGARATKETVNALDATGAEVTRAVGPVPPDVTTSINEYAAVLRVRSQSIWKKFTGAISDVKLKMQGLGEFKDELRQAEREVKKQEAEDRAEGKRAFRETLPEAMAQVGRDKANARYQETLSRNYGLHGASQVGENIQVAEDEEAWFKMGEKMDAAAAKEPVANDFADLTDDAAAARAKRKEDKLADKGAQIAARRERRAIELAKKDEAVYRTYDKMPPSAPPMTLGRKLTSAENDWVNDVDTVLTDFVARHQREPDVDETLTEFVRDIQAAKPKPFSATPRQSVEESAAENESASRAA